MGKATTARARTQCSYRPNYALIRTRSQSPIRHDLSLDGRSITVPEVASALQQKS